MSPANASPLAPPAELDLVLAFVNTHAGGRADEISDGASLTEWLDATGRPDLIATDADAAVARELRDALQTLLLAHSDDADTTLEDVAAAEQALARVSTLLPMRVVVTRAGVQIEPTTDGTWGVFAAILAAVTELDRAGAWSRVKACRNHVCHTGFFDRSRNSSAVYHGPTCASSVSMRAYRQRIKDSSEDQA
jgi:predicted RNA-binding Zn ribbon-like protein